MRTLVYLVCVGEAVYGEMARVCVDSLRAAGRYGGDLVVLTDGAFEGGAGAQTVRVSATGDATGSRRLKLAAWRHIDASAYDRVLFLDLDVVAVGDLAPLFAFEPSAVCAGDEYPFNRLWRPSVGSALRWWERLLHGIAWGVNAGAVCFPAGVLRSCLERWEREMERCLPRMGRWIDQPALNACIVRREFPFVPYPRSWIELPPLYAWLGRGRRFELRPETKLLHICGFPDKRETLRHMRAGPYGARTKPPEV
ncbi:MAG: hypothetical protein ACT4PV_08345 [Planctomycetaceae bacterium]